MADLNRALIAATAYFLALFAIGFVLGTIRVIFVVPHFGQLSATFVEVPVMLAAACVICRWVIYHWQVSRRISVRWSMVLWFLALLFTTETLLGLTLFGRTLAEQWAALLTPAGLVGVTAQIVAGLLPVFVGKGQQSWYA
jgi:hypothetical protein